MHSLTNSSQDFRKNISEGFSSPVITSHITSHKFRRIICGLGSVHHHRLNHSCSLGVHFLVVQLYIHQRQRFYSRSKSFNKPNICTLQSYYVSCFSFKHFLHFAISLIDAMIFSLCIRAKCLNKASGTKCRKKGNDKNCSILEEIDIFSDAFLHLYPPSVLSRPRPESLPVVAFLIVSSPPIRTTTSC